MNRTWIAVIGAVVALLVGGAIGWAIGANTGGDHGSMNHGSMDHGAMGHGAASMDQQEFLAMMVAHHQMAVDMSEAELATGKDPKVKAIARTILADQKREIAQMRSWYRARYGADVPAMDEQDAEMSGMLGMAGMTGEAVSGAKDPDEAFLRLMIPHHAGAILMADMVLNGAPDADVRTLAEGIIDAQSAEIAEMQQLRSGG